VESCRTDSAQALNIRWDATQAQAVLGIVSKLREGRVVENAEWEHLLTNDVQVQLLRRELGVGNPLPNDEFLRFVLSPELAGSCETLSEALASWLGLDPAGCAQQALAYLPDRCRIQATCCPVIKPLSNSFVFGTHEHPLVFLWLDPGLSIAKLANTLIHELHHVGFYGLIAGYAEAAKSGELGRWLWPLGEGLAMLAAAGSPEIHPHAASSQSEREHWDQDMEALPQSLASIDEFFRFILRRSLRPEEAEARAMSLFGFQGPWYTVGYHMAATIERNQGRAGLLDCMTEPHRLLLQYEEIPSAYPRWSPEVIAALSSNAALVRE
jgi:hypothetical protein